MTPTASTATELIRAPHIIRSPHSLHVNVKRNAIKEHTLLFVSVNFHVFAHVGAKVVRHTWMLIPNTHVAGAIDMV